MCHLSTSYLHSFPIYWCYMLCTWQIKANLKCHLAPFFDFFLEDISSLKSVFDCELWARSLIINWPNPESTVYCTYKIYSTERLITTQFIQKYILLKLNNNSEAHFFAVFCHCNKTKKRASEWHGAKRQNFWGSKSTKIQI